MSGPMTFYNENDPYAAAWLENLIACGEIPEGHVETDDIRLLTPRDLVGYAQCHFFAGIGGWPRALRLADWPDDIPVWSGSCPCQPFSGAGRRRGEEDERKTTARRGTRATSGTRDCWFLVPRRVAPLPGRPPPANSTRTFPVG